MSVIKIRAFGDLMFVVNQVNSIYEAKQEPIKKYLAKVKEIIERFQGFHITQILGSKNKEADALSKLASVVYHNLSQRVQVEVLPRRSIVEKEQQVLEVEDEDESWMNPLIGYLKKGTLPSCEKEERKNKFNIDNYIMFTRRLYRKGYLMFWLIYLS